MFPELPGGKPALYKGLYPFFPAFFDDDWDPMTLSSMTGFARAQGSHGELTWVWEARSVNGKGLDVRLRLPPGSDAVDQAARKAVADRFKRGNVNLTLTTTQHAGDVRYTVNEALLAQLVETADRWRSATVEAPRMDGLLAVRGVLEPVTGEEETEDARAAREGALLTGLVEALDGLARARAEEGARLAEILTGHLDTMESLRTRAGSCEALRPEAVRARMQKQVADLLEGVPDKVNEDRLMQELALLAVKGDVREELDRLSAHIQGARDMLAAGGVIGRRLEFLSQELNREANTLCSKSQDVALTRIGLDLKAVIDQFREQILNVE